MIEIKIITDQETEVQQWGRFLAGLGGSKEQPASAKPAAPKAQASDKTETAPPKAEPEKVEPDTDTVIDAKLRKELEKNFKALGKRDKDACKGILAALEVGKVSEVPDDKLDDFATLIEPYFAEPETNEGEDAPASDKEADKQDEAKDDEPKHTLEELRTLAIQFASGSATNKEKFRKMLDELGVRGVNDVPAEHIEDLYAKLTELAKDKGDGN